MTPPLGAAAVWNSRLEVPCVMGILNPTPDSFSDGGRYATPDQAVARAHAMVEEGAAIIDVGGESTRPGAMPVPLDEELRRVIPVVARLTAEIRVPISIDTSKPQVMRAAVDAGAGLINDVNALRAPAALEVAAALGVPVCLMHMRGEPRTMQQSPVYEDAVGDVIAFLRERIAACRRVGIGGERLIIDPGFGFGKTLAHNLALLARLDEIAAIGPPVLIGISRKSMLGQVTGCALDARGPAGLAAAVMAVERGARIVRTHDVAETRQALQLVAAVQAAAGDAVAATIRSDGRGGGL